MSKHTPGPWEAHNGEVTTRQENGRSYRRIAAVQDYGIGSLVEVDEANARLIAAAPDLLEALKDLSDWGRTYTSPLDANSPHDLLIAAINAITKATGEER